MTPTVILGAGISGLATSYHLGHERCVLLEAQSHAFGHVHSALRDGLTWDEGPHVSFTKHDYVRELFARSVGGEFEEFEVRIGNYFRGHWIDHPAQVNLHQVPEPLRQQCLDSFLTSREEGTERPPAANYHEWLERAFGPVFTQTFPVPYTRKYWRREPRDLATDWVGQRVLQPDVDDVVAGARAPLARKLNYITRVRYPRRGGFEAFVRGLAEGARIRSRAEVVRIDLAGRRLTLADGSEVEYERLINTLPLPEFVRKCVAVPAAVRDAAEALDCTSLLLVNVVARQRAARPETWFYVYDADKISTRINFTEHLSPANAPEGRTGIQVETYAHRRRPFEAGADEIARRVRGELIAMGLLDESTFVDLHTHAVPWANVIFDHDAAPALDVIWNWLMAFGLTRRSDDTRPLTDWSAAPEPDGRLAFAGRYGQWKYFWSDDCVLRGRDLAAR